MSWTYRVLICIGLLILHYVVIIIPLAELFLVYIVLFNPRWFRNFLNNLDKSPQTD